MFDAVQIRADEVTVSPERQRDPGRPQTVPDAVQTKEWGMSVLPSPHRRQIVRYRGLAEAVAAFDPGTSIDPEHEIVGVAFSSLLGRSGS
jgi:hypothetical protein